MAAKHSEKRRINVQIDKELFDVFTSLVEMGHSTSRGALVRSTLEELTPIFKDLNKAMKRVHAAPQRAKREAQIYLGESMKEAQLTLEQINDELEQIPDSD